MELASRLFNAETAIARAATGILVAILYFALAKASLAFASIHASASPIWPPTGLAVALVLVRGLGLLPAIGIAAFAANLATTGDVASSLAIAVGNALEAGVAAHLVHRWAEGRDAFQSPRGIFRFTLIMAAIGTPLSATIGVGALTLTGFATSDQFVRIWSTWWLGNLAGAIVVAPAITLWMRTIDRKIPAIRTEGLLAYCLAAAVGIFVFSPLLPNLFTTRAWAFAPVLPLVWSAMRHGPRETATVALILSMFAVWGVVAGHGPFVQSSLNESFLTLVAFVASATLPSLALSAAIATRDSALSRHEKVNRLLIGSISDHAVYMLDPAGRIVSWNPGAERINGYGESEIIDKNFRQFFTTADRNGKESERMLSEARRTGRHAAEGWRVRKDGSQFWASVVLSAIQDGEGRLLGFANVTRDMTEKREAQVALERAKEELSQMQKLEAIGRLTGGIAHDFNNLLMTMASGLRMIDKPEQAEQRDDILQSLHTAIEQGQALTNQLLTFGRRDTLNPVVTNLAERIDALTPLLARSLRNDIVVEAFCEPNLWAVKVDPGQFDLSILNLAVNSRDAMPKGGLLRILAKNLPAGRGSVSITVSDTGVGIAPEIRSRVLEPFFTTKEPGSGTGLGLSQVYGFAKQSGGSVQIRSEINAGTSVTIVLPRAVE